ncbi:hypothetical protein Hanom_Chr03g00211671 [Helianthus anomalus]
MLPVPLSSNTNKIIIVKNHLRLTTDSCSYVSKIQNSPIPIQIHKQRFSSFYVFYDIYQRPVF